MEGDTARHALTLLSAPGLGPSSYRALISHFGSPESVLEAPFDALCAVEGIGLETAQAIRSQVDSDWASRQLDACKRLQVQLLHLSEPGYPHLLRQTYAPPPILFLLGDPTLFERPTVAIVGSRAKLPLRQGFCPPAAKKVRKQF